MKKIKQFSLIAVSTTLQVGCEPSIEVQKDLVDASLVARPLEPFSASELSDDLIPVSPTLDMDDESNDSPNLESPDGQADSQRCSAPHPVAQSNQENPPEIEASIQPSEKECEGDRCVDRRVLDQIDTLRARREVSYGVAEHARGRGSNSQYELPNGLLLDDFDGNENEIHQFLQVAQNRFFKSSSGFKRRGILHKYLDSPIKRVISGDFDGLHKGQQACFILENGRFTCYGWSPDRTQAWWWFYQNNFIGDDEDSIVGDFTGDGRHDILVYPKKGGKFRLYEATGEPFFELSQRFDEGNLAGLKHKNLRIRAGDFDGNGRDDLVVVNDSGQILVYGSVEHEGKFTFWWAFTSKSLARNKDVLLARVDDDAGDDIVMHDRKVGSVEFFKPIYNNGDLQPIPSVESGQILREKNSKLFVTNIGTNDSSEYRDDFCVFRQNGTYHCAGAAPRNSKGKLTYWWAFTELIPKNHRGWAPRKDRELLFVKCLKGADEPKNKKEDKFYRDLVFGPWGLNHFWSETSYGSWNLRKSVVDDSWYRIGKDDRENWDKLSRYDRVQACFRASGHRDKPEALIGLVQAARDRGNSGGHTLADLDFIDSVSTTFLAHEIGHTFGWMHSFDDTSRKNADWARPGEYFDHWDIMSAMAVKTFSTRGISHVGPAMNSVLRNKKGFIPKHRIREVWKDESAGRRETVVTLAAVNRPEANGSLLVSTGTTKRSSTEDRYYLELREPTGFDQGLKRTSVFVRRGPRKRDGAESVIQTGDGGPERLEGSSSTFKLETGETLTVEVVEFFPKDHTAKVAIRWE